MQKPRPFVRTATDIEWLRRSRLTNSCLLAIGLIVGAIVGTSVDIRLGEDGLDGSMLQPILLLVIGGWLLIAYLFSRARRYYVAGGMIVALVLSTLTIALYLLPAYYFILLIFATLPIALAALLLTRGAVYMTAAITILTVYGARLAAEQFPAPALDLQLPPASDSLAINASVLVLFFLAVLLAPLRGELARQAALLRQHEASQADAEHGQRLAESARDATLGRLTRQLDSLEILVQHIGDGVIAVNTAGKIVRANTTSRGLWAEIATGELVGQRLDQLRQALTGPTAAAHYVDIVELPGQSPDRDDGYTHVLLDRREQARLARLRSELMSLLADEMRNPLTSMVTALEMTIGQNLPDGTDRVLVGARRSGQRLLDLVTTMLEINQIEHNPNALRRSPAPLRPILDAGIAQTSPLQHQGAVTVVVEYSGDGTVMLDSDRMRRAFVHLLEHAIRQSPPYSTVQVRTESHHDTVIVRISDQGPGLTPQQRELLFDQRVTSDERRAPSLGLAYSKLVIETHGGRVVVESSGSQGSTYVFTLPSEKRSDL
jgi:signal transduction histidine kinase